MNTLKDKIIFIFATKFTWLFILLFSKLARIKIIGRQNWTKATSLGKGVLIAVWHGRLLLPIYVLRNQGILPMVSQHRDGEMIAQTVERLGYKTIRGSSTRGGRQAYEEMLVALKNGVIG